MGSPRRPRSAIHRRYRLMVMDTDTDGIIHRTEARGVTGVAVQDRPYILRYLRNLRVYLRNRRYPLAPEGLDMSARGGERGIGIESEIVIVGGNENEEDMEGMEDRPQEADMNTEETRVVMVGSVGVCRIHRVRVFTNHVGTVLRQARPTSAFFFLRTARYSHETQLVVVSHSYSTHTFISYNQSIRSLLGYHS